MDTLTVRVRAFLGGDESARPGVAPPPPAIAAREKKSLVAVFCPK
jgi:hypothetical protein